MKPSLEGTRTRAMSLVIMGLGGRLRVCMICWYIYLWVGAHRLQYPAELVHLAPLVAVGYPWAEGGFGAGMPCLSVLVNCRLWKGRRGGGKGARGGGRERGRGAAEGG